MEMDLEGGCVCAAGDDADEVAWLTRAENIELTLPTAPAILPLIDSPWGRRDV
jgi:hypothetical protein